MRKIYLALAGALCFLVAACNTQITTTTANLVALNNALVQVNISLVDNAVAQAKLLAPYNCAGFAIASAILSNSAAAAKVNRVIATNVAASVSAVSVSTICSALGYPTTVTAAAPVVTATVTAAPAATPVATAVPASN